MKKLSFIFFILFFITINVSARKIPTQPNSYNGMALSARSLAMGNTGAAAVSQTDNIYFNPAGLAYNTNEKIFTEVLISALRDSSLPKQEINRVDPTELGLMSIVLMQKFGAISWRTLSSYETKSSDENNWSRKQENIKAVTLSVGNTSSNGAALGVNISYLYGTLAESSVENSIPYAQTSSGNGFSIDVGMTLPLKKHIILGVNFENIAGFMWWSDYGNYEQLPFTFRSGAGYYLGGFSLLADYSKRFYRFGDMKENFISLGAEQYLTHFLCVRAGAESESSFSDKENIKYTYGFGLNISIVTVNFAAQNYKLNSENVSEYFCSVKANI